MKKKATVNLKHQFGECPGGNISTITHRKVIMSTFPDLIRFEEMNREELVTNLRNDLFADKSIAIEGYMRLIEKCIEHFMFKNHPEVYEVVNSDGVVMPSVSVSNSLLEEVNRYANSIINMTAKRIMGEIRKGTLKAVDRVVRSSRSDRKESCLILFRNMDDAQKYKWGLTRQKRREGLIHNECPLYKELYGKPEVFLKMALENSAASMEAVYKYQKRAKIL